MFVHMISRSVSKQGHLGLNLDQGAKSKVGWGKNLGHQAKAKFTFLMSNFRSNHEIVVNNVCLGDL